MLFKSETEKLLASFKERSLTMVNDPSITSKREIINLLKKRTKCSGIRLPESMEFSINKGVLKVHVNKPDRNMQTDGAAFEGWITALKVWIPDLIKTVELDFSPPSDLSGEKIGNPKRCHYNRFLYRVNNYARLFPDWFSLSNANLNEVGEFMGWLKQEPCWLNHSLRERKSVIGTNKQERQIESWFAFEDGKKPLCNLWDLDSRQLFNQLPIGIFHNEISSKNAVFTRGASAIDLWGIGKDGTSLHIIELKCGDNIRMGVISEILFYTFILFDTCISQDKLFRFGRYANYPETEDMKAIQNGGQPFKELHSHILAERYHPLFCGKVTDLINEGFSGMRIKFDRAIYDYENKSLIGIYKCP
jgi:hypothetical protein